MSVLEAMNYTDEDLLFAAIGEGHVTPQTVAERLGRELRGEEETETLVEAQRLPSTVNRRSGGRRRRLFAAQRVEWRLGGAARPLARARRGVGDALDAHAQRPRVPECGRADRRRRLARRA